MAKYCSNCGGVMDDSAVACPKCGAPVGSAVNPAPAAAPSPKAATVLGILGIVFAWIIALFGHVLSIIGIILGIKEYKTAGKSAGLILSIIGEACALLNSLLGILLAASLFA